MKGNLFQTETADGTETRAKVRRWRVRKLAQDRWVGVLTYVELDGGRVKVKNLSATSVESLTLQLSNVLLGQDLPF